MKNETLFNQTVGILVKAFFEGVLEYGDPCGCAVGNMVAANMGYDIVSTSSSMYYKKRNSGLQMSNWGDALFYGGGKEEISGSDYKGKAKAEIDSTGYTLCEIADIEKAFHDGTQLIYSRFKTEENFNGLMSVVDCLMKIHEATTEEATAAKELFTTA